MFFGFSVSRNPKTAVICRRCDGALEDKNAISDLKNVAAGNGRKIRNVDDLQKR